MNVSRRGFIGGTIAAGLALCGVRARPLTWKWRVSWDDGVPPVFDFADGLQAVWCNGHRMEEVANPLIGRQPAGQEHFETLEDYRLFRFERGEETAVVAAKCEEGELRVDFARYTCGRFRAYCASSGADNLMQRRDSLGLTLPTG